MKAIEKVSNISHFQGGMLAGILQAIGWILLIGGVIAGVSIWPESSYRYEPSAMEFAVPIALIASGFIWCVIFIGFAGVLTRLDKIIWLNAYPADRVELFDITDDFESDDFESDDSDARTADEVSDMPGEVVDQIVGTKKNV